MSHSNFSREPNLPAAHVIEGIIMHPDAGSTPSECFKASLLRAAYDTLSVDIPEDFQAARFEDYTCPFVTKDNSVCTFTDPMVFMKQRVGFVAMGSRNFCKLEQDSPRAFKKAALGGVGIRAMRFGKEVSASIRHKLAK